MTKAATYRFLFSAKCAVIVDVELGFYVKVKDKYKYVYLTLKALY